MAVIFIGDSITEGFNTKHLLPDFGILNKGVSGDSTEECLSRIGENWFPGGQNHIFICIGTNDLARGRSLPHIFNGIIKIIQKVRSYSPSSIITVTSLFPTRDNEPRPNEVINQLNTILNEQADKNNYRYWHLHSSFVDDTGALKSIFTDDGLHLNENAYNVWSGKFKDYFSRLT